VVIEWQIKRVVGFPVEHKRGGKRMKKALVAIDGSPLSHDLVRFAFRLARKEKLDKIDFLHVYEEHPLAAFPGMPVPMEYDESYRKDLEREFRSLIETAAREAENAVPYDFEMILGVAYSEIVRRAERDEDVKVILVGHRGMRNLERFFIGSVAAKVAAHAPCTVIVFRPREPKEKKSE
jgi:nucleotide-binding universal stress UspA family protein